MRLLILVAATAVALGACRNNDQAGNSTDLDQSLTAENIVSNDVTAIDAVTADAANMAADVDYSDALGNLSNNSSDAKPKAGAAPGSTAATVTNSE